jgi:hypothetical protein
MQQPKTRKGDVECERALRQWWEGIHLEEITLTEPFPLDRFANFFRVARWVSLIPGLVLACLFLAREGTRAFPNALWLPAVQLVIIAIVSAYIRYRRWQEVTRDARQKIAQENGDKARLRRLRHDRLLSTSAYHSLRNFQLSKFGLAMYAFFVVFGGSSLILGEIFRVLDGGSTLAEMLRVIVLAYPGMSLFCCPIGVPAFLLWWYCRWRLRSWQRLEEENPEAAMSLLAMKIRAEKLPDERDGAVIVPSDDGVVATPADES